MQKFYNLDAVIKEVVALFNFFSRNLLRRGYGGQEERKDRKGVGGGLCPVRLHAFRAQQNFR